MEPQRLVLVLACLAALPLGASGSSGGRAVQLAGWRIEGDQAGARLGTSLAGVDVNGDGFGDLVVGAPGAHVNASARREGRVLVYLGASGGLASTPDWSVRGVQAGARLGTHVAAAGDVNGDGFEDVIVSAPGWDRHPGGPKVYEVGPLPDHARYTTDEGAVFVFHGSPTGLAPVPARILVGIEVGERFGSAIAGAGDVNGDGFDDVLVGATGKLGGLGAVFLFSGSPAGTGALPGWVRVGTELGRGYGSALGPAGDVNGDGFDDFLCVETNGAGTACGKLMLFRGSAAGPPAAPFSTWNESRAAPGPVADFDQDGQVELLYARASTCSRADADRLAWRRIGSDSLANLPTSGLVGAVTAGDVNGDGWVDFVASEPAFESDPFHGRVHVYLNRPGATFAPLGACPTYHGDQAGAGFGSALAATDVDGDGAAELFVAAPEQDEGEENEGVVVLHPGWSTDLAFVATNTIGNEDPLVTGDFDGNGCDDLVSTSSEVVRIRYGSPAGLEATAQTLTLPPLAFHNVLLIHPSRADVDGNGYDDLLLSTFAHFWSHGGRGVDSFQHVLYLGTAGRLGVAPALTLPGEGGSEAELVGDVNGDGYDDLLWAGWNGQAERLHLGTSGGLSPAPFQTSPAPGFLLGSDDLGGGGGRHRAIHGCDLDGDPYRDVVIARVHEDSHTVYLSIRQGSPAGLSAPTVFQPIELSDVASWTVSVVDVIDLDLDGAEDLLLDVGGGTMVFRGTSLGFERAPQWFDGTQESTSFFAHVALARTDLDGDAVPDLLLNGQHIHRGSSTGFLREPEWFGNLGSFVPPYQTGADFDGDGRKSFTAQSGPTMTVYEVLP
jgi:hypothetical protein